MQPGMQNRFRIAVLIYSMTNAVIFGAGIITVLNVSALRANAFVWIPVVVIASLILTAPFAWLIAASASTLRSPTFRSKNSLTASRWNPSLSRSRRMGHKTCC